MPKRNLAARAGYWSAKHRKIAIGGWLAFVVIAFILGGAIGTNTLADEDTGNGESRVADTAIHDANFPDKADEQVLVQSRDGKLNRPATPQFKAGVEDVVARLEKAKHVQDVESPLAKGNEGQISEDGRSALVTFSIPATRRVSDEIVDASLAATAAAQKAHPDLRIEQFGDSSADKALGAALDDDFKRAEFLSLPITMIILIVAFGALVAAGVPLLLAITAVIGTLGLVGPISQIVPMEESANSVILLIGLAVGVDYSMFYLRRKMEERDAGTLQRSRARVRRRHLRQGGARLRPHGDDRHGRHVPRRQRRLHLLRRRHDARRRGRDARQRHRPPRGPLQARRQRREGPRPDHRPHAPPQPRRVARLGLGHRQGARAPGRLASSPPAASCSCSRSPRCT